MTPGAGILADRPSQQLSHMAVFLDSFFGAGPTKVLTALTCPEEKDIDFETHSPRMYMPAEFFDMLQ